MSAQLLPFWRRGSARASALLIAVLILTLWRTGPAVAQSAPDVIVSGLTVAPSAARVGDPVTATVTVRNQGSGVAGTSLVGLYLGTSSTTPLASAVPLGTLAIDGLAPGAAQQLSLSFTVPGVAPGSFSVIAAADQAAELAESNEANNRRTATLRVTHTDLTVSHVALAPWHARTGDTVTATVTVHNAGAVPASASTVRVSFEPGAGAPAQVLGSLPVGPLAPGQSQQLTLPFSVPAVPHGRSYYVWAQTDPEGTVPESNEGNNRRGTWLLVTVPDLTISALSVRPAPTRAGDPVSAVVVVRNRGLVPADASTVRVSFEPGAGAPAQVLGLLPVGPLAPGQSQQLTLPFSVPAVPHGRSYYVWAQTDPEGTVPESNEGNNRRGTWLLVTIPDLTIGALSLKPAPTRVGDPVAATVVVRNAGQVPANASTLRLSFEPGAGAPAQVLGSLPVGPLAPGQSQQLTLPFSVPAVPHGRSYYVWAQTDPDATLLETSEGNNRRGTWLLVTIPDLTISALSLKPAPARVGDPVAATVVVRNAGQVPANASTLRLSFEPGAGAPAQVLGSLPVGPLAPGQSQQLTLPFSVPAVPHGRSYYVWAQTDPDATLLETSEGNNRRGVWLQVSVPDLTITSLSLTPVPTRVGDPITVTLRLRNHGPVPANGSRASLYVTTASNASLAGLTPAATVDVPPLGPGKEAQLVQPVSLPVLAAGYYHLVAVADSGVAVAEGNEANNRRATGFEVAMPVVTVDTLGVTPSLVSPGQAATASVRIVNRGHAWSRPTTADVFLATNDLAELHEGIYVQTIAINSLGPGGSASFLVSVPVPLVDPGAHYVIAQVDASAAVGGWTTMLASAAETGSSPSQPRRSLKLRVNQPDLTTQGLTLNPVHVRPGESVTVSFTVRNAGSMTAAATEAGVYLAPRSDASLASATRLGTRSVPSLPAGSAITLATTVSLPAVAPGPHYVIVAADPDATLAESIESNNRTAASLDVLDTSDELTVWVVDPLTRVQRTDPPGTVRTASIKAARNEYEMFQVVVRAPDDRALVNVDAVASDLVGPGVIGHSNITLYRAHYIPVTQSSPGSPYPPGWWPDALIPFKHPETGQPLGGRFPAAPFPVSAGQNQPVWVEVYVPPGTPSGVYTGAVTVTAGGLHATVVPITLTVWNFTLPTRSSMPSAFGELWCFWDKFGISANSTAMGDLDWLIAKTALQHRVTPGRPARTLGWFASDGTALPANGPMQEWFGTLGATSWQIPSFFADPVGADRPRAIRYLRTLHDYLAARGWADRAFVYTATTDEPGSAQDYQEIRDFAAMVHEANSNLQVLVTGVLKTPDPTWGTLEGSADIWVPVFRDYDPTVAQARRAAGDRVWTYQVGGWGGLPSLLIDFPILNYRVPLWISWVNRVDGLLYWQMTYWCQVADPWTDARTWKTGSYVWNGEGSLFYPGNAVGYSGPIVSARLKALRDGMEDYEYLKLLATVAGTGVADTIARTVGTSFWSWNRDATALKTARETLAERIEIEQ